MKTPIKYLTIIFLMGLFSCEKNNSLLNKKSYIDYLSDKAIVSIRIFDDDIWLLSNKYCDTCYVSPIMSSRPIISQLTVINDSIFDYEEPTFVSTPTKDNQGNLYTASQNKIFKINRIKDYEIILETGEFDFNYFTFDKNDNIWLGGYNGIAFWNGSELKIYNTSNSELPSNITHGLAIDNTGIVWIALDFKGLLKITDDKWEIISNSEIPGLKTSSYLWSPIVDNENNIWFNVFSPATPSCFLKYDGNNWNYVYPDQEGYGYINIDTKGTIWIINAIYENSSFKNSTLTYLQNNEWINFDVTMIKSKILTVNSDDKNVYIGTVKGLRVVEK